MFGLEEISSKVVQWDRMEQLALGGNQTSLKKNSYMTKLIFWESGYLINILKGKFFLRSITYFKVCNICVRQFQEGNMRKQTLSNKQSMSQYIWHSIAIIYKPALDVQKAHRLSSRIHLGNKPTLANNIQAGPTHTLFAHQLRTHRSNTHSFLQQLLVFIFGLES